MSWTDWNKRLKEKKKQSKIGDEEIAAFLAEKGYKDAGRAAINHWLNKKRPITLNTFFEICEFLGADPGEILFEIRVLQTALPDESAAKTAISAVPTADHRAAVLGVRPDKARQFKAKANAKRLWFKPR